jgi:hypothetical protein
MTANTVTQRGMRGGDRRPLSPPGAAALSASVTGVSVMHTSSPQRPLEQR